MRTIVAGRIIKSEAEFVEAALGFIPTTQDLKDFAEFVEDTCEPASDSIDAENIVYLRTEIEALRERERQELEQLAGVVPLPRRRSGVRLLSGKEVRAA
ncbi:hypothetical protein ABZ686_02300 [Streptomyces sp. NPDC006992]|uniref:hypothetical protein n=1 Tax=Streptomyces sp. NPDC006992 TaxID=3155601 RepID=UPI0033EC64BE